MSKQRINITADGSTTLRIPAAKKYITVDNNTESTITIYDNVGMLNPANILYEIKPYSSRCYPLEIAQVDEALYTMTWNSTTYPSYFDILLTTYDTHSNLMYPRYGSNIAYTWQKIHFDAAGDSQLIATDVAVTCWECTGSASAYPLDGANAAWKSRNNKEFIPPIHIRGTFKMHANAACDVWVLFMT